MKAVSGQLAVIDLKWCVFILATTQRCETIGTCVFTMALIQQTYAASALFPTFSWWACCWSGSQHGGKGSAWCQASTSLEVSLQWASSCCSSPSLASSGQCTTIKSCCSLYPLPTSSLMEFCWPFIVSAVVPPVVWTCCLFPCISSCFFDVMLPVHGHFVHCFPFSIWSFLLLFSNEPWAAGEHLYFVF